MWFSKIQDFQWRFFATEWAYFTAGVITANVGSWNYWIWHDWAVVARALDDGINGMRLAAVATGRRDKAAAAMTELSQPVEIMSIAAVAERCDIVVDCAPKAVFRDNVETTLGLGRIFVTVSGAGILANPDIEEFGRDNGGLVICNRSIVRA